MSTIELTVAIYATHSSEIAYISCSWRVYVRRAEALWHNPTNGYPLSLSIRAAFLDVVVRTMPDPGMQIERRKLVSPANRGT